MCNSAIDSDACYHRRGPSAKNSVSPTKPRMISEEFPVCIGEVPNCHDCRTIIHGAAAARIVFRAPFAKRRLNLSKSGFSILDGLNFRVKALRATTKRILLHPHSGNKEENQNGAAKKCPDCDALGPR